MKPCPACGEAKHLIVYLDDTRVICNNAKCELGGYSFDVSYWNSAEKRIEIIAHMTLGWLEKPEIYIPGLFEEE